MVSRVTSSSDLSFPTGLSISLEPRAPQRLAGAGGAAEGEVLLGRAAGDFQGHFQAWHLRLVFNPLTSLPQASQVPAVLAGARNLGSQGRARQRLHVLDSLGTT